MFWPQGTRPGYTISGEGVTLNVLHTRTNQRKQYRKYKIIAPPSKNLPWLIETF